MVVLPWAATDQQLVDLLVMPVNGPAVNACGVVVGCWRLSNRFRLLIDEPYVSVIKVGIEAGSAAHELGNRT